MAVPYFMEYNNIEIKLQGDKRSKMGQSEKKIKKQNSLKQEEEIRLEVRQAVHGKNVPIAVLDERWLKMFPKEEMTETLKSLQKQMHNLLKQQGRMIETIKGYKRYKSQLMQEIVDNMEVNHTPLGQLREKKLQKNQKLIIDLNNQLLQSEDELANIPGEIRETNEQILEESTYIGVQKLLDSSRELKEVKTQILAVEQTLLELKAQERELEQLNRDMYLYLNDMFGTTVMRKIDTIIGE